MEYTKLRNKNRGYMKLDVWQKGIVLFQLVWDLITKAKVDFKLRSQIANAAQGISSNIAEGYSRRSVKEYLQFLYVSLGCLSETLTRSVGLKVINQISEDEFNQIDVLHYEIENKLWRLVESLQRKKDDGTWSDRVSEDLSEYPTIQ